MLRYTQKPMNNTLWRLLLMFWLVRFGYAEWWQIRYMWRWTADECWQMYREDCYRPRQAVLEDLSYA